MVKKIINFFAALALSLSAAALNVQATEIETNTAKLQAMNKLTGRVSVIDVPVNGEAQFGSFSIVVRPIPRLGVFMIRSRETSSCLFSSALR